MYNLSKREQLLYDLFYNNKDKSYSRKHLCRYLDCSDSITRNVIGSIRKILPIINLQGGEGYMYTTNKELLKLQIKQERSRMLNIQENIHCLEKYL